MCSKEYPKEIINIVDNMLHLHFSYEDIYDQVQISMPNYIKSMDELLDLIIVRITLMIK